MRLGYMMVPGKGEADRALAALAEAALAEGLPVLAAVQYNSGCTPRCDMDLRLLPGGETFRISQNLGEASSGCRLDPAGLETAVGLLAPRLDGAGALIINKFGKHEAEGRGFRDLIAQALALGMVVLVGVNDRNRAGFAAFAGGIEEQVNPGAGLEWLRTAIRTREAA